MNRLIPALLLCVACGTDLDASNFPDEIAPIVCDKTEVCALGYFESTWRDQDDCIAEIAEEWRTIGTEMDAQGCVFDAEEAAACMDSFQEADCEAWYEQSPDEDCADVWVCPET
jgi:hypothetical protein